MPDHAPVAAPPGRLVSIDALRGFDMFWIIGADAAAKAWLQYANPSWKQGAIDQLEHVAWEGFRFYDLIFPLFLFIVGVVIPFSLGKLKAQAEPRSAQLRRIMRRTVLILVLGLIYNNVLQLKFDDLRYAGVLQRIGLCYFFGALAVVYLPVRGLIVLLMGLLLSYWAIFLFVAAPGSAVGDVTPAGNLAGWLDRLALQEWMGGKILKPYYGYGDNEGILSTIPAVGTTLLGVLAGYWLLGNRSPRQKTAGLAAAGVVSLGLGYIWSGGFVPATNLWVHYGAFPIIKNLWTSSFLLWAGGWSLLLLAGFYGVIDGLGWKAWAFPFVVIGSNAILIYVLDRVLDIDGELARFFFGGIARVMSSGSERGEYLHSAVLLSGAILLKWLLLWFLYKKRIFLRA